MSSYLLLGPEAGAKADEVKRIRSELAAKYGDGLEFERFYPFDGEQGELFASLANDSLFSDHRLILISQLESAGAAFLNELAGYLANPSPSATVVLASSETSITKKIMDAIPKERTRIFYDLLEGEKSAWIRTHFRRLGLTITSEAVELLIAMTEDNTQELRTVCNQLALFWQHDSPTKPIDEEAVQTYLHHSRVEDAFTLFPHLAAGDLKKALAGLHALLGSGDYQTPILLVSGLLWQFRRLLSVAEGFEEGKDEPEVFSNAHVLLKNSAIRRPKDKTTYREGAKRYSSKDIRSIIIALAQADIEVKQSRSEEIPLILERLIYRIINKKGKELTTASFATLL
ncbi:MAG: DNA polymerase III subunit delta [Spirochaetes bacterium ADurb.Bin315]|jgi:DNA polymerase-3 subunit delta|nr:DNA polymerase III subunit delta [Spirochaetota bacterium]OQA43684.1 MAG: DNA polymerase III subunit delta [Spirochaetes bacterium ADurb.Bin315]HOE88454.1 DNA polymerase III subunit delta [Sphaerochaeta sp.]HOR79606.1 DNA polymerase III subunit delta [Sphaerochaeta sp.]HPK63364.1 DNA polymerase III subunit delta [Sphaerochaeta sp.]